MEFFTSLPLWQPQWWKVDIQYFVECHCLEELPNFSWQPTAFVTRDGSGMSRLLEGKKIQRYWERLLTPGRIRQVSVGR